uniref:C6 domain-containing protein n=1 Tax=Caenorhabditis tropicalis TaxID=1561998 RepID=A0A1I7V4B8_9PELO
MKFILNILLVSSFIALASAACEVCACDTLPPTFTQEIFDERINDSGVETRTYVAPNSVKIVNCEIVLECTFSPTSDYDVGRKVVLTETDDSTSIEITGVTCKGGAQWDYDGQNVTYIGCYLAQEKELEGQ